MKKPLYCLVVSLVLATACRSNAQRYSHHFDRKERAEKIAEKSTEDLNDYVTGLSASNRDSIQHYFVAYYGNAMTYSPTCKVRKISRTRLDARVKKVLSSSQFDEYEMFMKDVKKKQHRKFHRFHHKHKHKHRHDPDARKDDRDGRRDDQKSKRERQDD